MKRWMWLLAFVGLTLMACTASDNAPAASAPMKVITLDPHASQLRADFNAATGSVRLLLLVDPACSVCLRGLADVNDALLEDLDDPRVQTFVVHTDVIGGKSSDVAPAAGLVQNRNVRHYWDPTGKFGKEVTQSLQLKRGAQDVYAWDVWMIYDGKAQLAAEGVPAPALFMHQLPPLKNQPGRPLLDGEVFAAKARELLSRLPPARAN
jgi:hypothetical protein